MLQGVRKPGSTAETPEPEQAETAAKAAAKAAADGAGPSQGCS